MVRVGNTLLIVVLSLGLLGAATYYALSDSPSQPGGPTVEKLVAQLGDDDDGVSRGAELALMGFGNDAVPYLETASKSADPRLASRARDVLKKLLAPPVGVE